MGQGFLGFVGLGKETTLGTAVAATDYLEALNENVKVDIDRFETRNIVGGFHEPDDSTGLRRVSGDISMFGHPVSMGHILKAAMNTLSGSVVLSGFLWTSRFITPKSEFAYGAPTQPYTFEIYRDVTSSHRYAGMQLNRMTMALGINQDLRLGTSWIGVAGTLLQATSPTFPGSSTEPFTFDTASVQLGGSANARIEALTVTVDNQLEGIASLNNSTAIRLLRRRGPQTARISGSIDFQDVTEYLDFINQTERALNISVTKANSFQLVIAVPRFQYTGFPTGIPGRERLTVAFEGKARYHVASGVAIDFQLTTTKSNW